MTRFHLPAAMVLMLTFVFSASASEKWMHYPPMAEHANGKKVVLIAAGWEYRAEEGLTMLAKILSQKHGFDNESNIWLDSIVVTWMHTCCFCVERARAQWTICFT